MDEVKIGSELMQGFISKIIRKLIRDKTGYSPVICFNDPIQVSFDNEKAKVHLNINAELSKEELESILKKLL